MIKLLKIISKISMWLILKLQKLNRYCLAKSRKLEQKKKRNYETIVSIYIGLLFIIFAFFVNADKLYKQNIQDLKPVEVKKEVVKVNNNLFHRLKKYFPWLQYETYKTVVAECEKNNIDPKFMLSVIQFESGAYCKNDYDRMIKVVSRAGAIGICQIMPFHASDPNTLYDPQENIKKGAWYLGTCFEYAGGNVREASRMYNQGVHGKKWKYRNWSYVNRIDKLYKQILTDEVMNVGNL